MTFEAGPAPQPLSAPVSLAPSYDAVEILPPKGADKLRALRQHWRDRHALTDFWRTAMTEIVLPGGACCLHLP
jgi:hypothetical protein